MGLRQRNSEFRRLLAKKDEVEPELEAQFKGFDWIAANKDRWFI